MKIGILLITLVAGYGVQAAIAQGFPCGTQEFYNLRLLNRFGLLPNYSQCQNGPCDLPEFRNSVIPGQNSPCSAPYLASVF